VVVDCHGQNSLGPFLSDDVRFQSTKDLSWSRELGDTSRGELLLLLLFLFLQDLHAEFHTLFADEDVVGAGDQPPNVLVPSVAK
jgi:hypothetical protein